jgi:flagellar motor switch protein FliG
MNRMRILQDHAIFKKMKDVFKLTTEDGTILTRSSHAPCIIYCLENEISSRIWDLIENQASLKEIKRSILTIYRVDKKKAEKEVNKFISDLYMNRLISIQH